MKGRLQQWLHILFCTMIVVRSEGFFVDITYVESGVPKGAVCLDGSPPAYHIDKGFGDGIENWLVHVEGGGWCNNVTTCLARKSTRLGSSKQMAKQIAFSGIFSNKQQFNPDFYNWNRVKCFFPENMAQGIQTPMFLVNAAYDSWQIKNSLAPGVADPHGLWHNCKTDINKCSTNQLQIMQGFRTQFLNAIRPFDIKRTLHQLLLCTLSNRNAGNVTIAKAVGDWFYDRNPFQKIDCPYPCDKTCHNRIFDP